LAPPAPAPQPATKHKKKDLQKKLLGGGVILKKKAAGASPTPPPAVAAGLKRAASDAPDAKEAAKGDDGEGKKQKVD